MDLAKTQFISLVTKGFTTVLGVIQSVIVIRLLAPAEFGLVGLVMSIGGVVGVTQHLGIVDGAIREIAVLKNKREIGKVFWVSHLVRQLVTLPLTFGLIMLSSVIAADIYGRPEIVPYLQLFALSLILQGFQDVLGATLTGVKRFGSLYAIQILTATINIGVFGYLTWRFGITGFFWAVIITTSVMVLLLLMVVIKHLRGYLALPSPREIQQYAKRVMRVGVYMYVARIFFVLWQRLPLLLLGGVLAADELGFLNVSLTFGARLTIVAMALSEVNLSWMSSLFAHERERFKQMVQLNLKRVFLLMMGLTMILLFFAPEILLYVVGEEYLPAREVILVMTVAFFLYALLDIGTSSAFVPADKPGMRASLYGIMMLLTGGVVAWLLFSNPTPMGAAWGVLLGATIAYLAMLWLGRAVLKITFLSREQMFFLLLLFVSLGWLLQQPLFWVRLLVFLVFAAYLGWESRRQKVLPSWSDFLLKLRGESEGSKQVEGYITCFAGAVFDAEYMTNRQHIMSRLASRYRVLYVEPRVWIFRYIFEHWRQPILVWNLVRKIVWVDRKHDQLFVKAQWNLLPGSRESRGIALFNHYFLNRWNIWLTSWLLGFNRKGAVVWLYDTEAAEYLDAYPKGVVVYDCVDDHAAQAGVDRNPRRVEEEEAMILSRADLVTVTSQRLFDIKSSLHENVHLVLNAGDVALYENDTDEVPEELSDMTHPILGSVGALDGYKYDFGLLHDLAVKHPEWNFVLLGQPVVQVQKPEDEEIDLSRLRQLQNVHVISNVPRIKVPNYVRQFDVCLIPYRASRYNASSFPLKFWEFMATGKPVVAGGLPELKAYEALIGYANDVRGFEAACRDWLASPLRSREKRLELAREHSWDARVAQLEHLLNKIARKDHENRI